MTHTVTSTASILMDLLFLDLDKKRLHTQGVQSGHYSSKIGGVNSGLRKPLKRNYLMIKYNYRYGTTVLLDLCDELLVSDQCL